MKVALIHDWLNGLRGGERCLLEFLTLFPSADVFTLVHTPGATSPLVDSRVKQVSTLQSFPLSQKLYRHYLPLFPAAAASLKPVGYDLVISLSHAAAKNIHVPCGTPHLCYCFTPMRYIWDQASTYFGMGTYPLWPILSALRAWDKRRSEGVSEFVAISRFVAARIRKFYGRKSTVVYPPVDTQWITPRAKSSQSEPWFLYAGAFVPYKKPDLVVQAFNVLGLPLKVVGSGPLESTLRELAGPTVEVVGRVSDKELGEYYSRAKALLFPVREDFGMVPIEALAGGCPVIGCFAGALRETVTGLRPFQPEVVISEPTGVFYAASRNRAEEVLAIADSVRYFLENESSISAENCVSRSRVFSPERFRSQIVSVVRGLVTDSVGESLALDGDSHRWGDECAQT